jgi:hypothetical protein
VIVTAESTLFPWGAREGLPCVALDITGEGDLPTMNELMDALGPVTRPGTTMLWLRDVPWGSHAFDKRIHELTYSLSHMAVVATADTKRTAWTNLQNVQWVLDATALVSEPTTSAELQAATVDRAHLYLPPVAEIVVTRIHPSNLLHPILSALAKMWCCEVGTVYVTAEQVKAATMAVSIAGTFAARVRA